MKSFEFTRLELEHLEAREVPASFGNTWLDPMRMTVSFAPDGTGVGSQTSALFSLLENKYSEAAWKTELLRAIQTWVEVTNLNIGLVADSGKAFGSSSSTQFDPFIGDIRFGATSLSQSEVAQSLPYQPVLGSWSGDILFNNNMMFGNGTGGTYDLYTVALQEVGHALGLANSPNSNSVMYDQYLGVRSGLSSEDVAAIQALYSGPRRVDEYDAARLNDSSRSATTLDLRQATWSGLTVMGDLTTSRDVDFYKFTATTTGTTTIDLRTHGLSLLTGDLTVYDSRMRVLGTVSNTNPLNTSSISLRLSLSEGQSYTIRVQAAKGSTFGVGGYQLQVAPPRTFISSMLPSPYSTGQPGGSSLSQASDLTSGGGFSYRTIGMLSGASDQDYFRFAILPSMSGYGAITVGVFSISGDNFVPTVELLDSAGNVIQGRVLVNQGGNLVLEFAGTWQEGAEHHVRVGSIKASFWNTYVLGIGFQSQPTSMSVMADSILTSSATQAGQRLKVGQSELYHFSLGATGPQSTAGVRATIYNDRGEVVTTLSAGVGQTVTANVWLEAGIYTVVYAGGTCDDSLLDCVAYCMEVTDLGDSIDPYLIDPLLSPTEPIASASKTVSTATLKSMITEPVLSEPVITKDDYSYWWLGSTQILEPTDPFSQPFWF